MSFKLDAAALELLRSLEPCDERADATAQGAMSFTVDQKQITPAFQFNSAGMLFPVVREINAILALLGEPAVTNKWWLIGNGWLNFATPMSLLGTPRVKELHNAARMARA